MKEKLGILFLINVNSRDTASLALEDSVIDKLIKAFADKAKHVYYDYGVHVYHFKKYNMHIFLVKSDAKDYFKVLAEAYI